MDRTKGSDAEPLHAPRGNTYDKYGGTNPLERVMVARFRSRLNAILDRTCPHSQLDCGCGEGVLTHEWALRHAETFFAGIDLADPDLEREWASRRAPNLEYRPASVTAIPYEAGEFDLVSGIEVLEHVSDADAALAEMTRVARCHVLVSVPREPLWRAMNLARGAYVREWGNTPGHVNHWTSAGFIRLVRRHGRVMCIEEPIPWTIVLLDVTPSLPH